MNNEQFVYRIWNTKHKTYIRTTSGKTIWASKQAASRTLTSRLYSNYEPVSRDNLVIHKFNLNLIEPEVLNND